MSNSEIKIKKLWTRDGEYSNHRIPGIFVTSRSTLLVYNEARRTASDWALMDIFLQRSTDGGESFGEPIYLARGDEEHHTVNNPVILEDDQGRLHLLYCRDYTVCGGGAWHRTSDDDGLTWSEPREITDFTLPDYHNAFAFGPGHGIRTSSGLLLVPIWMVPQAAGVAPEKHAPSVVSTISSRDRGKSWQIGEIIGSTDTVSNPNETAAAETADGRIMLNIRSASSAHRRAKAWSADGIGGWSEMQLDPELRDPICFGSMISYSSLDGRHALIAVNCDSETERKNITLKVSFDGGESFTARRTVDADRGGYCDLAADEKSRYIYIIYEDNWGADVYLARLTPEWLLG